MIWWLVMRKQSWEDFQMTSPNMPFPFVLKTPDDPDQPVGFLPIFATQEAAEKWADGDPIQAIQEIEPAMRREAQ